MFREAEWSDRTTRRRFLPPPPQSFQMAVVVLGTLPILLVYPLLQRYFTKGVLTGAIKG